MLLYEMLIEVDQSEISESSYSRGYFRAIASGDTQEEAVHGACGVLQRHGFEIIDVKEVVLLTPDIIAEYDDAWRDGIARVKENGGYLTSDLYAYDPSKESGEEED